MNTGLTQVCLQGPLIVGAGSSGLAVAACRSQRGVPFLILEKENCIASLLRLRSYDSLKLHLPKKYCQLPQMPFPKEYPVYPTKQQFLSYLDSYAKHFSIHPMFRYEVKSADYNAVMGVWRVVANGSEYLCRWLAVATGDDANPAVPGIDGLTSFGGKMMHTSDYKDGTEFRGRKVLVVGCGNSGMEISLNLYRNGARMHILPRDILGRSSFGIAVGLLKLFPLRLVDWFLILSSRLLLGDTRRVGIIRPEDGPLKHKNTTGKTPVLDVVGEVQRFTSNGVEFMDGKVEEFDSVILATGYTGNVASWLKVQ
ncbi:hypothetical protein L1987_34177 [Smallanthus sonchifolius]|uniref:Uncharacterized protein n=1 Tax=Smallanthus sonchifolius TaxID=185202 RepID=A0ACB9HSD9_9ASTR|nr:hypothetical protein L1987_34177 [Smallanthus sonchifolius]